MFNWPRFNQHQCHTIPIEGADVTYTFRNCENKNGYERIKITSKIAQCPVCKSKYTYDSKEESDGHVSYAEVHNVK